MNVFQFSVFSFSGIDFFSFSKAISFHITLGPRIGILVAVLFMTSKYVGLASCTLEPGCFCNVVCICFQAKESDKNCISRNFSSNLHFDVQFDYRPRAIMDFRSSFDIWFDPVQLYISTRLEFIFRRTVRLYVSLSSIIAPRSTMDFWSNNDIWFDHLGMASLSYNSKTSLKSRDGGG